MSFNDKIFNYSLHITIYFNATSQIGVYKNLIERHKKPYLISEALKSLAPQLEQSCGALARRKEKT